MPHADSTLGPSKLPPLVSPPVPRSRIGSALREVASGRLSEAASRQRPPVGNPSGSPVVRRAAEGQFSPAATSPPAVVKTVDRRAHPRRDSGCSVAVYCCRDGEVVPPQQFGWRLHGSALKGVLIDISLGGAAFVLPDALAEGASILLRLNNRVLGEQLDVGAKVLRSMAAGPAAWKVVCRFARPIELEQVQRFGRHLFPSKVI